MHNLKDSYAYRGEFSPLKYMFSYFSVKHLSAECVNSFQVKNPKIKKNPIQTNLLKIMY